MAAQKIMDIVVKTGEYQDNAGMTKGRYQNVGSLKQTSPTSSGLCR
ncbi:hypothetical protein [Halomonas halocynthiae]|nr:hypothetical protein [Halomonas halocynthiae]